MPKIHHTVSPAKINLYLNVLSRDSNSYHNIVSVVERISLKDHLYIKVRREKFKVKIKVKGFPVPEDRRNSLYKVLEVFRDILGFKDLSIEIDLLKNIPPASGLGGHSSNASALILFLNRHLGLNLNSEELIGIFSSLSKDIGFFTKDISFALVEAKGERVTPLKISRKYKHILWLSPKKLKTSRVYASFRTGLTRELKNVNIFINALQEADFDLLGKSYFNALERSAVQIFPQIWQVKDFLIKKGMKFVGMSGSGPTLFCLDRDFRSIPDIWGNWRGLVVRTF